eukprot:3801152-Pyramimonas_sp.AAC.1
MAQDGPGWPKMAQGGPSGASKMAQDGSNDGSQVFRDGLHSPSKYFAQSHNVPPGVPQPAPRGDHPPKKPLRCPSHPICETGQDMGKWSRGRRHRRRGRRGRRRPRRARLIQNVHGVLGQKIRAHSFDPAVLTGRAS